jgi:hypothetical protein
VHGSIPVANLTDEQLAEEMQSVSVALGARLGKAVFLAAIMPPPSNVVTRYGNTVDQNGGAEALVGFLQLNNAIKVRRLSTHAKAIISEFSTRIKQVVDATLICSSKVETNPAYAGIAKHIPLNGNVSPTFAQLADDSMPSEEDSKNLVAYHNEMEPCRRLPTDNELMKTIPGFMPILLQTHYETDLVIVDLVQRKITWSEANRRRMTLRNDYKAKIQALSNH